MPGFDDIQKMNQVTLDTTMKGFGELGKSWQAIATEMTSYSKRSFEESTATFERLASAKSLDQVMSIQTDYAKRAYEDYIAQMSRLSAMYVDLARDAYKPLEKAAERR
jgi:hypothetical protein